jgi:phage FluMu protein Com
MIVCQHCRASLQEDGEKQFIVKCRKCNWYNRFKFETLEGKEIVKKDRAGEIIFYKKQINGGILYTYPFNLLRHVPNLKIKSKQTAEALEKFLFYGKERLTNNEKNVLYKLKVQSTEDIERKIDYLEAKKRGIEILRLLEF